MKLKDGFVTYDMDGDQIMVSVGGEFHGMARSNATAAFILGLLREETSEAAIIDAMAARYAAPREQIAADVRRILAQLQEIGAVE